MEQFEAKINKLIIESENESATGDVFITKPDRKMGERLGVIFGLVELFALADEFADGFFEIINDLKTEYYLPPMEAEYGVEKRFEECLQRTNRRLDKLINQSIIKIELKNINALVGLIYRNKIYLSQIGKNNAFVFHQKKKYDCLIIDIFSQTLEKKSSHRLDPEKMFSNIINGDITVKDSLLFCNDSILEYFSQNELSEIITENDPLTAIKELENNLGSQAGNNFYAIIIQPIIANEIEASAVTKITAATPLSRQKATPIPPQSSINSLLKTQERTEQYLTPSLMPNWQKFLILILTGFKKIIVYFFKYLSILIKYLIRGLSKLFSHWQKKLKLAPPKDKFKIVPGKTEAEKPAAEIAEAVTLAPEIKINNEGSGQTGPLQKISDFLNKQIAKFVGLSRPQKILLILAFILIFIFSQNIVWRGQNAGLATGADIQKLVQQINDAINEAEAKNIFNDEAGAKDSVTAAYNLLNQIPDKQKYKNTKSDLQAKISEVEKLLQKISYLDQPTAVADLSNTNGQAQSQGLIKINNLLFSFDNQNNNLYKIDLDNKQILPVKLDGPQNVKKIAALNDKTLIILDSQNNFYQYDLAATSSKKILSAAGVGDFDTYGGKIYTLQTDKNQIFKHLPVAGGFNNGGAWLKSGADLNGAAALTLDGGVFVIKNSGQINYFVSGKAKDINFAAIDPAIKSPTQIFSNLESNYLYILDPQNQRIVVYDKNGNLKIQYTSKQFANLKSMAVVEKEKKIYVLNDNKIYSIDIKF